MPGLGMRLEANPDHSVRLAKEIRTEQGRSDAYREAFKRNPHYGLRDGAVTAQKFERNRWATPASLARALMDHTTALERNVQGLMSDVTGM